MFVIFTTTTTFSLYIFYSTEPVWSDNYRSLVKPDIDHVSHHHEIFGEFSQLKNPASVSFKLAGRLSLPSPPPPTAVLWLALSTLLGDDKNGEREERR